MKYTKAALSSFRIYEILEAGLTQRRAECAELRPSRDDSVFMYHWPDNYTKLLGFTAIM